MNHCAFSVSIHSIFSLRQSVLAEPKVYFGKQNHEWGDN